jgi:phosphoglucosamine mutase
LIRPSGTEPLIRVMVEATSAEIAESMARRIADKIPV